jgi:hypothetical protein
MKQVFTIVPAGNGALWFFAGISLFLLLIICLFGWLAWSSKYSRFEVTPDGLRLVGDLWGRRIPASALIGSGVRVVDLRRETDLAPKGRRAGTALPGFAAGWFRLRNGDKGLVYLTDFSRVVVIPTSRGYTVLLSPTEPDRLADAVRRVAGG